MRVVCVGGGPAGLFFAINLKRVDPNAEVAVYERNQPDDTFGWGVVFSDQTLGNMRSRRSARPTPRSNEASSTGTTSTIYYRGRACCVPAAKGSRASARKRLLAILQERCARARRGPAVSRPRSPDDDGFA